MKRFTRGISCVIAIIIISILFCQIYSYGDNVFEEKYDIEETDYIVTQYKTEASDDFLWETLSKYLDNEKIIAGIMGYFKRESQMRSNAIAGWATRDYRVQGDSSAIFTAEVDEGLFDGSTKEYFIEQVYIHFGGYGLGQWLSIRYLDTFYDFAQNWGTSIADAEMQCAFVIWSLQNHTPELWAELQEEKDLWIIGRKIGHIYDGSSGFGPETIATYAQEYYKKYVTE